MSAVRAESQCVHRVRDGHLAKNDAGGHFPKSHDAVIRPGNQAASIRAKGDAQDDSSSRRISGGVKLQDPNQSLRSDIPNPDRGISGSTCEKGAVRTERDASEKWKRRLQDAQTFTRDGVQQLDRVSPGQG